MPTLAQLSRCSDCGKPRDRCVCTSPELDDMVQRASRPTLAKLYEQAINEGVLQPTMQYNAAPRPRPTA